MLLAAYFVAACLRGAFFILAQVAANGMTFLGKGGLSGAAATGLTIAAGGLAVSSGEVNVVGTSFVTGGVTSIVSTSASSVALDVYASAITTGNVIVGRVQSSTNADALTLLQGTSVAFQVRKMTLCLPRVS